MEMNYSSFPLDGICTLNQITSSTCHAVGVGSIVAQISHDRNPIRVEFFM